MHLLSVIFMVFLLAFSFDSEAKRMGSGKNLGKTSPAYNKNQSNTQANQNKPNNTATPPRNNGLPGWLGPVAGLMAGGIFAALLFGGAFSSLQLFDILLFIGIGVIIFFIIKKMRQPQSQSQSQSQYQYAGNSINTSQQQQDTFHTPSIGSALNTQNTQTAQPVIDPPHWFDKTNFLEQAKKHFIRLQTAWDRNDMSDIKEYTTPELFADLQLEREKLSSDNYTEVVEVTAELTDLSQDARFLLATVYYTGLIKEEKEGEAQPFTETWVIQRDITGTDGNWYIAGIQQAD